jgi:hypothetical protein
MAADSNALVSSVNLIRVHAITALVALKRLQQFPSPCHSKAAETALIIGTRGLRSRKSKEKMKRGSQSLSLPTSLNGSKDMKLSA